MWLIYELSGRKSLASFSEKINDDDDLNKKPVLCSSNPPSIYFIIRLLNPLVNLTVTRSVLIVLRHHGTDGFSHKFLNMRSG